MSAQPIPISKLEELTKRKRAAELRSDVLYIAGAVMVTVGLGMLRIAAGLIAGGCFCLLLPCLELATGFIRGLHAWRPRSR